MSKKTICDLCDLPIECEDRYRVKKIDFYSGYRKKLDICESCWAHLKNVIKERNNEV